MKISDVRRAIREGDFDLDIDRFYETVYKEVRIRRRELAEALVDDFAVGQRVKTTPGQYKPRYMFNRVGTVTKIEGNWVWLELDEPVRRSGGGYGKVVRHIGVSPLHLEHIDDVPPMKKP